MSAPKHPVTRRVLGIAALMTAVFGRDLLAQTPQQQAATPDKRPAPTDKAKVRLTVNEQARDLELDPRTTLLDAYATISACPAPRRAAITASAAPAPCW